jgi:AraC-like DNA-binding protein
MLKIEISSQRKVGSFSNEFKPKTNAMKLIIKNMFSARCVNHVACILKDTGISYLKIELGQVELINELNLIQKLDFKNELKKEGFELIENSQSILAERIKLIIIQMVHYSEENIKTNFSVYLSEQMKHNYTYLSNVFRAENGMSIQQFIIMNKVERIKTLLLYGELNLSEISYKLNYSSIAHLSNQFKKITGFSPTHYRHLEVNQRIPIEKIGA